MKHIQSKRRDIFIIGEINEEMVSMVACDLAHFESQDKAKIINVILSSIGGCCYDAMAIVGMLRNSPCDIVIKAYGCVQSAAVPILACGDVRYLSEESWIMVHQGSSKVKGETNDLVKQVKQALDEETAWCRLMAKLTSQSTETWTELHKKTTYLTADEALQLGLCDKVLKGYK